jgi:hypothetical protein
MRLSSDSALSRGQCLEMRLLHTLLLVLLALCGTALADFPFKKKPQEFTTHKPDDVAQTLRNGTPVQRNDLAQELGIFAPNPSSAAVKPSSPCVNFSAEAKNMVLLADSSECDSTYVAVFDKAPKSEWRHVQTVRLPARAQRPEVSFAELVQTGVSEILVHHENTRDSGSARQDDFVVLKMLHDRMEVVLDATERSEITLANRSAGEDDNRQTETSTFSLLKSAPNSTAIYRVLEKEVVTDNKTTITRYQVWTWDPEVERFRPAPFDGGDARPALPPAKKPATKPSGAEPPKPAPKPN